MTNLEIIQGFRFLAISFFMLAFVSAPAYSQQKPESPNIVVFIADDLGVKDIGPYGNSVVRTPHLDRLASESMLFKYAFAASPTCGPSRSSLLTGMLPMRHGAHGNHSGVKEGTLSMIHYLAEAGYDVAIAGKLHVGPASVFPFERIAGTNVREPGYENIPGLYHDLNLDPVDIWLAKRKKGKPFVLVVADHSPHVIWPEKPLYSTSEVDIPEIHIDTEDTRKARARYYTDVTKMDGNVGQTLALLEKHKMLDHSAFIFTADQGPQWAFGKWGLYDYGVQVPLLIRWPGNVPPHSVTDALVSQIDLLPTFIDMAGNAAPATIDGISFLHVLRNPQSKHREVVFASHTGDLQMNRSPMRMLRTARYKYILNLAPQEEYNTHMNLAKDHDGGREYWPSWREASFRDEHAAGVLWRYHHRPKEELYDLLKDPWERTNIAQDSSVSGLLEDFRKKMIALRNQQGDTETGPEEQSAPPRKPGEPPIAPYVF